MSEKIFLIGMSVIFISVLFTIIFCAISRVGSIDFDMIEQIIEVAGEMEAPEKAEDIQIHGLKVYVFYYRKEGHREDVYKFRNTMEASYFAEAVRRRMEQ